MTTVVPSVPATASRLPALDGLRGLAALLVVVFHGLLVSPELADVVRHQPATSTLGRLVTLTPLRLLWSGEEAVLLFFVLSGFVLALPFLRRPLDAVAYYPRRLVRIYVPVWGSVALALLWSQLVPRTEVPGGSWWVNAHDFDQSLMGLGGDLTLVVGTTWLNSVLWSLKWEMWFSLLLPLYLLVLVRLRRLPALKLVVLLAAVQAGAVLGSDPLRYLPVFGVGVLLAAERERAAALVARCGPRGGWLVLAGALLVLAQLRWLTGQFVSAGSVLAAAVLVALFAWWAPAVSLGSRPVAQWLGTVSFSLYLVHEPVVTSVAVLLGATSPLPVLAVALPASLALAWGFHRVVEQPAHRLARWTGDRSVALLRHRSAVTPTI